MKRLIALISPENKTPEKLAEEMFNAIERFFEIEKKALDSDNQPVEAITEKLADPT